MRPSPRRWPTPASPSSSAAPRHGTSIEDMVTTRWADWSAAAERPTRTGRPLLGRGGGGPVDGRDADAVAGRAPPEIAGIVLVNPSPSPRRRCARHADRHLESGTELAPGIGSDIAKEGTVELAYASCLSPRSLAVRGGRGRGRRPGQVGCPVLLLSSRQDHVVEPGSGDLVAAPCRARSSASGWSAATRRNPRLRPGRDRVARPRFCRSVSGGPGMTVENGPAGAHPSTAALSRGRSPCGAPRPARPFRGRARALHRPARVGLDYAADVAALDLTGVRPTAHPLPVVNVLRDDVVARASSETSCWPWRLRGGRPLQRAAHRRRGAVSADGRSARRTAADIASAVAAGEESAAAVLDAHLAVIESREPDSRLRQRSRRRSQGTGCRIDRSVAAASRSARSLGCRWP